LVVALDNFLSFSICQIPLLTEVVTQEWRFPVADSGLAQTSGNNLEPHLSFNPLGVCPASRLCLPLPYLRCQDTHSAPSLVPRLVLYLYLPSPPWAYWDPGLAWKTHAMVPYDFLKLFPYLVFQAPSVQITFKSAARRQWRQRHLQETAALPHTNSNPAPTRGGGKSNRLWTRLPAPGCRSNSARAKVIHRESPAHIQSRQPYWRPAAYSPKRDERKNKHVQVPVPGGRGDRPQGRAWADRVAHSGGVAGWQCFVQAPFPAPPHALGLTNLALGANSYLKVMVLKERKKKYRH
jgi:hypothetical protein